METKRKILVKYRNGEKIRQISREAQISCNTIRGIIRNKEQIKEGYERKVQPYPAHVYACMPACIDAMHITW